MKTLYILAATALVMSTLRAQAHCDPANRARAAAAADIKNSDDFTPDDGPAYVIHSITAQSVSQGPTLEYFVAVDFGPPQAQNTQLLTAEYDIKINAQTCTLIGPAERTE